MLHRSESCPYSSALVALFCCFIMWTIPKISCPTKLHKNYLYNVFYAQYFHEIKCFRMYNPVVLCNFFKETINSHFITEIIPSEAYRRMRIFKLKSFRVLSNYSLKFYSSFQQEGQGWGGRGYFRHLSIPCFPPS